VKKTNCILSIQLKNHSIANKYYIAIWQYQLTTFFLLFNIYWIHKSHNQNTWKWL